MPKTQIQSTTRVDPINNLGRMLNGLRYAERTTLRSLSSEMGISAAALLRIERGHVPDGNTLTKLLVWAFGESPNQEAQSASK